MATFTNVEVLHLLLYWAKESDPRDQDSTEEMLLSTSLSSKGLLALKELAVRKMIDIWLSLVRRTRLRCVLRNKRSYYM